MAEVRPFVRVRVDYAVRGVARITWELDPRFFATGPISFQLQFAEAQLLSDPLIWINVGSPTTTDAVLEDSTTRAFGKEFLVFYRVVLTDGDGNVYNSPSANVFGNLGIHEWLLMQEIIRKEFLRLIRHKVGIEGVLLKAKRSGTPCHLCTDPFTKEQTDSECPSCFGQRFDGGYWVAQGKIYVDKGLESSDLKQEAEVRGVMDPITTKGRFISIPEISTYDVWCGKSSDARYFLRSVQPLMAMQGVPFVSEVDMRLIPLQSILYQFPVPR